MSDDLKTLNEIKEIGKKIEYSVNITLIKKI